MQSFKKSIDLPLGTVWLMNAVSEYKGKQDLYARQSPQVLKTLLEAALIESAESSNRIEGVTVDKERLKPLVIGHSKPRDRSEEEVAGYRRALDWVHRKHKDLQVNSSTIKELHRLCRAEAADAGQWKEKNNDIIRKHADGRIEVIFKPVSAAKTPEMVDQLCLFYENSVTQLKYPPLYAIACLVLDFLSIHPFRDGNGRVSRLLTLLALYEHGFYVGKYVSLERIVEQTKESYYETLNISSQAWHEGKHNVFPWFNYFLGTVLGAYKEFEVGASHSKPVRGAKTSIVRGAIEAEVGDFSIADIERDCPSVSRPMIRVVLETLRKEGKIKVLGTGRAAKWRKRDNSV
ncbi:MAG: Fic family protein [Candidatus Omnitrophica bacterium]|nr:Fic family protein [Candidatus Omnitrophota bacterium]